MKKLTTLAVTAAFVVVSQVAIVPDAQAFSFGSFSFSDNWGDGWGDSWGNGGYRGKYNPRWNRYPPPGYNGYRWDNRPRWDRGFNRQRFNFPHRNGFDWENRNGPRWGAPPGWGAQQWGPAPGYSPQAQPSTPVPDKSH